MEIAEAMRLAANPEAKSEAQTGQAAALASAAPAAPAAQAQSLSWKQILGRVAVLALFGVGIGRLLKV